MSDPPFDPRAERLDVGLQHLVQKRLLAENKIAQDGLGARVPLAQVSEHPYPAAGSLSHSVAEQTSPIRQRRSSMSS